MNQRPTDVAVLLIEDDDIDAQMVQRAFGKKNLTGKFVRAINGEQGIERAHEIIQSESDSLPIVLLDLNMPRVNGHEFLSLLRKDPQLSPTVVFVLTTSSHERDVQMAYQKNVAGYFTKDNLPDLIDAIKAYQTGGTLPCVGPKA